MNILPLLIALANIPVDERLDRPKIDLAVTFDHLHTFYDRPPLALWTRERFDGRKFSFGVYGALLGGPCGFCLECYWFPMGTGKSANLYLWLDNAEPIAMRIGIPPNAEVRRAAKGGGA